MVKEFKFEKLDQVLSNALIHETAKTTDKIERMRAETILLVMQHGGEESARRQLMKMADDLAEANKKLWQVRNNPIYKIIALLCRWIIKTPLSI